MLSTGCKLHLMRLKYSHDLRQVNGEASQYVVSAHNNYV